MHTLTRICLLGIIGVVLLAGPLAWLWQQPLHAALVGGGLLLTVALAFAADSKVRH